MTCKNHRINYFVKNKLSKFTCVISYNTSIIDLTLPADLHMYIDIRIINMKIFDFFIICHCVSKVLLNRGIHICILTSTFLLVRIFSFQCRLFIIYRCPNLCFGMPVLLIIKWQHTAWLYKYLYYVQIIAAQKQFP